MLDDWRVSLGGWRQEGFGQGCTVASDSAEFLWKRESIALLIKFGFLLHMLRVVTPHCNTSPSLSLPWLERRKKREEKEEQVSWDDKEKGSEGNDNVTKEMEKGWWERRRKETRLIRQWVTEAKQKKNTIDNLLWRHQSRLRQIFNHSVN